MEPIIKEIYTSVMEGEADAVKEKVQAALDAGIPASVILNDGMIAAMGEVGRLFEEGGISSRKCSFRRGRCSPGWRCLSRTSRKRMSNLRARL